MINETKKRIKATGSSERTTIGFLAIADFRSSLAQELVAGVNSAAKDLDVNLINFCSGYKYSLGDTFTFGQYYKEVFPFLNKRNIDGLISWASSIAYIMSFEEVEKFHAEIKTVPSVCLGMKIENIPSLTIDNELGIRRIMNHLVDVHGLTKIAFIGDKKGYHHDYCNEERFLTYKKVLQEKNIPYNEDLVYILKDVDHRFISQAVSSFFDKNKLKPKKDIEAIVTISDLVSNRLIHILQARNIQVPGDIAITGFNNTFEGIRAEPPLTTVDPQYYQYGYTAIQLILDQLLKKPVLAVTRMPVEFITRQSCGCQEVSAHRMMEHPKKQSTFAGKKPADNVIQSKKGIIETRMETIIHKYDPEFNNEYVEDICNALVNDMETKSTSDFVSALKKYFFGNKYSIEKILTLDSFISEIRIMFLSEIKINPGMVFVAENIFHQARVMIRISINYITMSRMNNTYQMGKMAFFAADYNAVENFEEFGQLLKINCMEFEIPGAFVVLTHVEANHPGSGRIVAVHQANNNSFRDHTKGKVSAHCILPKNCYPNKRYSMMFQLCNYRESYIGYVIFEMGPFDIPLYDTIRMIISPTIYRIIKHTMTPPKSPSLHGRLPNKSAISKSGYAMHPDKLFMVKKKGGKSLQSHQIVKCLSQYITEPTNIEKFALELNVSVSTLVRWTRKLTGTTVQRLHEKIKMERAMSLLETTGYKIAEIAEKLGYDNQFYFSTVFKKYAGITPLRWKKSRQVAKPIK
ncbi:MAG: substrate-binding domain-containing protein [Spirochaetales bacterium]|nr:substrate-binding domain-containing protein [Spirochaetales bacterium]